jgi:hypothetical protein
MSDDANDRTATGELCQFMTHSDQSKNIATQIAQIRPGWSRNAATASTVKIL